MLVDTEFPVKWITNCIPFGVQVYILERHSSLNQVTTVKATYRNFNFQKRASSDHLLS